MKKNGTDSFIDKITLGNCIDIMKKFDDNSIDLTITSPPYDNLRVYKGYNFPFESIATQLYRVTKEGGIVVWVVSDATVNGNETGTSFRQALYFQSIGFNLHDTMIFRKKIQFHKYIVSAIITNLNLCLYLARELC